MGFIRLLLALSVVDFHAVVIWGTDRLFGLRLPNGIVAVQMFFVISGFYMSLVLSDKYAGRPLAFYTSRFLRLFPDYWIVTAVTIVFILIFGDPRAARWANVFASHDVWTITVSLFTALFMLGQDWLFMVGSGLSGLQFISPAWTLGIELTFYAVAPLIVRLPTLGVLGILAASLAFRHFMFVAGYNGDPWVVRFFPFELSWFLFGLLGHRVYEQLKNVRGMLPVSYAALACAVVLILFCGRFQDLSNGLGIKSTAYIVPNFTVLGAFVVLVPFAFYATRNNWIDRQIGELSYPVYLVHWLVLTFMLPASGALRTELACALSIVLAIGLMMITRPIERWRSGPALPPPAQPPELRPLWAAKPMQPQ